MARRRPVDHRTALPRRAWLLLVASIVAPLGMMVALVALEDSPALLVVLGGVAALALLTAWVTSGLDDDWHPDPSRPPGDAAPPHRRDDPGG